MKRDGRRRSPHHRHVMVFSRRHLPTLALLAGGLLATAAALAPLPDRWTESPVVQRGYDALHLPLFGLAAAAVYILLPVGLSRGRRALIVVVGGLALAAAVELIQPFTGRGASWRDFFHGALGVGLAVWWVAGRRAWSKGRKLALLGASAGAVLVVGWPMVQARQHVFHLAEIFPDLLGDDAAVSRAFWQGQGDALLDFSEAREEAGTLCVDVVTRPGNWSGLHFRPGGQDWSDYAVFVLKLRSRSPEKFTLGLRIDDQNSLDHASRYHDSIEVGPEPQTLRLPLAKVAAGSVDLSRVSKLVLFVGAEDPQRRFVVERAFLE